MRPFSYSWTKAAFTARESPGSIVNRSRDQSHEAPAMRSWERIRWPLWRIQSQNISSNAGRPMSSRVLPSAASWLMSTALVAMAAWSVPGSQSDGTPRMRCQRIIRSWNVTKATCP